VYVWLEKAGIRIRLENSGSRKKVADPTESGAAIFVPCSPNNKTAAYFFFDLQEGQASANKETSMKCFFFSLSAFLDPVLRRRSE
jgi:hypothetical protein